MNPEKSNEWINEWLNNILKDIRQKIDNFKKEIEKEWWGLSWFFKALFKKEKEELTDEQKKTQEELDKLGDDFIKTTLNNLNNIIWDKTQEIQNILDKKIENEETILSILTKNINIKNYFNRLWNIEDDNIKNDCYEAILLRVWKESDDELWNRDWKTDLKIWEIDKLWEIFKKLTEFEKDNIFEWKTKEDLVKALNKLLKDDEFDIDNFDINLLKNKIKENFDQEEIQQKENPQEETPEEENPQE